jgi:hypothetical protein
MLRELVPLPRQQLPADVYTLQVSAPDRITVAATATKDEFLPAVYILDANNNIVAWDIDSVTFEAAAGTYRIVVSTVFFGGGDYKVSVSGKPLPVE